MLLATSQGERHHDRLNPFYFRAGLLRAEWEGTDGHPVLIPFISGLDCYVSTTNIKGATKCLNPFYFRAGLLRKAYAKHLMEFCLNPFYFRAGLLHAHAP